MSDTSSDGAKKLIEQPNNDPSEVMGQVSVTTGDSDETSPSLSDMKIDVVGLIVEKLDYKHQLKLRKVSKSLRALVDNKKPACKSIEFDCAAENINICFNGHQVMYTKQIHDYGNLEDYDIIVVKDDFKEVAFDDLASTLKNPKLRLEEFCFSEDVFEKKEEYYNEIQCVLESLNHQLSVKEVDLHVLSPSNLLSILPYLKPGALEKISLSFDHKAVDWRIDSTVMDKVAFLEQWKQAEELELWNSFDTFPMEYATHFKRFRFNQGPFAGDKFIRIKDYLSKLENFEQCTLSMPCIRTPDFVSEVLGAPVSSNSTEEIFHYSIPDSEYYLEFKKETRSIEFEITKKKREGN